MKPGGVVRGQVTETSNAPVGRDRRSEEVLLGVNEGEMERGILCK